MKSLEELINKEDPFFTIMNEWVSDAENNVVILPPSDKCEQILLDIQVTTHSILGSLIYDTGGVLVDHGWIRVLGSGHASLPRDVQSWNSKSKGLYLVADDAAGGFFAINGGAFPGETNTIYYLSPDSIEWESLDLNFSDFFFWLLNGELDDFYDGIRWSNWRDDMKALTSDKSTSFYPFLWTEQGDCNTSKRGVVPVDEALAMKYEISSSTNKNI